MSFNVDALGGLAEKLKQLVNETQEHYESLVEDSQLYKKGKIRVQVILILECFL